MEYIMMECFIDRSSGLSSRKSEIDKLMNGY